MNNKNVEQTISVCFGSSCHLKRSFMVAEIIKKFLKDHDLENTIELKGSLCMGQCANGVNIALNDNIVSNLNPDNAQEVEALLNMLLLSKGDNHDAK